MRHYIVCEGAIEGVRYLNGHTADSKVDLVAHGLSPEPPTYTGTLWEFNGPLKSGDVFTIMCLGDIPGNRFLNGHTRDGIVDLAPNTQPPYSGTKWRATQLPNGNWTFECRGDIPGNRFLNGHTRDGIVDLAPNTQPPYSGTEWSVVDGPQS
jgi:hypothetical protein